MPKQRAHPSGITYVFPDDFTKRLVRLQEEPGLPWAELNRFLDTHPQPVRPRRDKGLRASTRRYAALLKVADSLCLGHLSRD